MLPARLTVRVLLLAAYFPKPGNPTMGPWALLQAQALLRAGVELRVLSPTSWVPRLPGLPARLRAWADCPDRHDWDGLRVDYPRWGLYQAGFALRQAHRWPEPQLSFAYRTLRPALRRVLAQLRPDAVYAHHSATCGYLAARLHRETGLPYVVADHSLSELRDCGIYPQRRRHVGRVLASASAQVLVSREMEQVVRGLFPSAPTAVIYNGADQPPPAGPRPERLRERTVIACAAHFQPEKGVRELVAAFAPLARERPELLLRVAGDGLGRRAVEQEIRAQGLTGRVELLGMLPPRGVQELLAHSDLFALLSWNDSFPVACVEALAAGLPLLYTSGNGIREVVRDRVHGALVAPQDPAAASAGLRFLLEDRPRLQRMGEACRALFRERLTWDANAAALKALLARAAAREPREPRAMEAG